MAKIMEDRVELKIPIDTTYVSVIRLLVSGLATRLGLDIGEIEKLKLMVGEAFETIVARCDNLNGLIRLKWIQTEASVQVILSDPAGKHKTLTDSGSLAALKELGGHIAPGVKDGMDQLELGFKVRYEEDRPFLFNDSKDIKA